MTLEPLGGLQVVDLFAGSGALGIEALSRGAEHVDFVEPQRAARAVLEANLEALDLGSRARVWPLTLPQGLGRLRDRIAAADLVLLDPPYGGALARATVEALGRMSLDAGVRVVLEHHAKDEVPEAAGWLLRDRERRYGETVVATYRRRETDEEVD